MLKFLAAGRVKARPAVFSGEEEPCKICND